MPKNVFVGVGFSKKEDAFDAGKEAVELAITKIKEQGGKLPGSFGVLFCSIKYDLKKLVEGAHKAFGKTPWIGCTGGWEISENGISSDSVVASIISSDYIKAQVGVGEKVSEKPFEAGKDAIKKALEDLKFDSYIDSYISYLTTKKKTPSELIKEKKFAILTLPAGFTLDKFGWEDDVIEGIKDVVGIMVPIIGGTAGDDGRFKSNYQFANGKVYKNSVVLLSIFSNVKLGFGFSHGYEPTNKVALVTKSKDNIIYELNNKPALDVYAEMIGVSKKELLKGSKMMKIGAKLPPFAIKLMQKIGLSGEEIAKRTPSLKFTLESPFGISDLYGHYLARVPKGFLENGIEFYSKIPKNQAILLMRINPKKTLLSTKKAISESIDEFKKSPAITFIFECGGRYFYLGKSTQKTIDEVKKVTKSDFIGFYTHGEIGGPKKCASSTHYYTVTTFSISDELVSEK